MGNKQVKLNNGEDDRNGNFRIKRRLSKNRNSNHRLSVNSSKELNRSSSSPQIAKWRLSNMINEKAQDQPVIEINNTIRSRQQQLTNIVRQSEQNTNGQQPPSYHLNSKLYRGNSSSNNSPKFGGTNTSPSSDSSNITPIKRIPLSKSTNHLNTQDFDKRNSHSPKIPQNNINNNNNNNYHENHSSSNTTTTTNTSNTVSSKPNKSKSSSKLAKRFGLSPRFKRKLVETITNKVVNNTSTSLSTSNNHPNKLTGHALQSQWNLFSSIRMSRNQNPDDYDENDPERNLFHQRRRTETTATFLSTSLQRNSFRYASRRKYKTQSLANPYRHANTNYPVYIHEALFMPEFSVKGQVTEADFEILDVISRGAFGHVIKVKKKKRAPMVTDQPGEEEEEDNQDDDQIYAMKIMWKSQVIRDRALQQVKDEVTIAINCVDNPLIVKTWFYWQSKRFLYIITDYVENGELLSLWLKVHHFPQRLVILYAVEMCLVLDYLHRRGIIYRDIKMENILLDHRGHIQLIDFGLSKWLPMGERTGTICGTIQYMAPEILGVEPYDHAVDWWSLGILIYALLSGEYPLNAAKDHIQMNERVSKHVFELDQSKGHYSNEACDLVRKLLRKNPHRRLKSLTEIKQEPFFLIEVNNFINMCLEKEKQQQMEMNNIVMNKTTSLKRVSSVNSDLIADEHKKQMISENFWNPYVIMQNYSPLQMLFDEIYALKQKQMDKKSANKTRKSKVTPPPSPPPPPPPPPNQQHIDNSVSSSTASNNTTSNKSTDLTDYNDIIEDAISDEMNNNLYENHNDFGDDEDEDDEDEYQEYINYEAEGVYEEYDNHDYRDTSTGFTKF